MEKEIAALPDDALAGVLGCLPARNLAAARCVCKAWLAVVDSRALLLPHLLPRSVRGMFINYIDHYRPHLFARPSSAAAAAASPCNSIDGMLGFLPHGRYDSHGVGRDWWSVVDHCNGLVLCDVQWGSRLAVCNPATRRWTLAPPLEETIRYDCCAYLAFDPAVSPHYDVLVTPNVPEKNRKLSYDDDESRLMEWPPSPLVAKVFSSRTGPRGRWEERAFVREGEAAGTVEDIRLHDDKPTWTGPRQRYAVYQHGVLYVHSRGDFIMRYSLSNSKYQLIETPINIVNYKWEKPYLGKSKMGVLFGMIHDCQLSVWILHESAGQMEWVLKYQDDLRPFAKRVESLRYDGNHTTGPWTVVEDNIDMHENSETLSDEDFQWDSYNDDFLAIEVEGEGYDYGYFDILGFHPCKEVIFLDQSFQTVAYHLNSSKIQYLGYSRPECYYRNHTNGIYESFLYTPCMIGELHGNYIGQSSS